MWAACCLLFGEMLFVACDMSLGRVCCLLVAVCCLLFVGCYSSVSVIVRYLLCCLLCVVG